MEKLLLAKISTVELKKLKAEIKLELINRKYNYEIIDKSHKDLKNINKIQVPVENVLVIKKISNSEIMIETDGMEKIEEKITNYLKKYGRMIKCKIFDDKFVAVYNDPRDCADALADIESLAKIIDRKIIIN